MKKINLLTAILAVGCTTIAQTKWKVDKTMLRLGLS